MQSEQRKEQSQSGNLFTEGLQSSAIMSAGNSEAWRFMQVWGCISANKIGDLIGIVGRDQC